MQLTLLGTGSVQGAPVYGCDCIACVRATHQPLYKRHLCSAVLTVNGKNILIDANHPELETLYPPGKIDAILLTHYHMDHVHALFNLRWGVNVRIPVYQPKDPNGCDDLFKHPGTLDFQPPCTAEQVFMLADIKIMPLALNHSKPTLGYCFLSDLGCIAYLTDTKGLPEITWAHLKTLKPTYIVIDCSFAPFQEGKGHNNLFDVLALAKQLPESNWLLTHIGHQLDAYLLDSEAELPGNIILALDKMILTLE